MLRKIKLIEDEREYNKLQRKSYDIESELKDEDESLSEDAYRLTSTSSLNDLKNRQFPQDTYFTLLSRIFESKDYINVDHKRHKEESELKHSHLGKRIIGIDEKDFLQKINEGIRCFELNSRFRFSSFSSSSTDELVVTKSAITPVPLGIEVMESPFKL